MTLYWYKPFITAVVFIVVIFLILVGIWLTSLTGLAANTETLKNEVSQFSSEVQDLSKDYTAMEEKLKNIESLTDVQLQKLADAIDKVRN